MAATILAMESVLVLVRFHDVWIAGFLALSALAFVIDALFP